MCSDLGGTPLFNQTNLLTRDQVDARVRRARRPLREAARHYDPSNRLLNNFFAELLGSRDGD